MNADSRRLPSDQSFERPRQNVAGGNQSSCHALASHAGRVPQPPVPTPPGIAPVGSVQPGRGVSFVGPELPVGQIASTRSPSASANGSRVEPLAGAHSREPKPRRRRNPPSRGGPDRCWRLDLDPPARCGTRPQRQASRRGLQFRQDDASLAERTRTIRVSDGGSDGTSVFRMPENRPRGRRRDRDRAANAFAHPPQPAASALPDLRRGARMASRRRSPFDSCLIAEQPIDLVGQVIEASFKRKFETKGACAR